MVLFIGLKFFHNLNVAPIVPISYGLDPVRRKGGLYLTDDDPSWRPRLGSSPLAGVCLPACPLDGPEEDDGWGVAMASR
jgi:hypothetical protein